MENEMRNFDEADLRKWENNKKSPYYAGVCMGKRELEYNADDITDCRMSKYRILEAAVLKSARKMAHTSMKNAVGYLSAWMQAYIDLNGYVGVSLPATDDCLLPENIRRAKRVLRGREKFSLQVY